MQQNPVIDFNPEYVTVGAGAGGLESEHKWEFYFFSLF